MQDNNSDYDGLQIVCIMYTEIVGYKSVLEKDPFLARQNSDKYRHIHHPIIQTYNGRIVIDRPNGITATFVSATDAVLAGVAIQHACSLDYKLNLKIGIHLAEVKYELNNLIGDGLPMAEEVNNSAPIGGVYITEFVKNNLANKRGIQTKFVGLKKFKSKDQELAVYQVKISESYIDREFRLNKPVKYKKPDPHSIAILPFENINKDPEVEYLGDGMAEEILNLISNFKGIKVICRTSSFQFKDQKKTHKEISEILDVGKILTGSVDKNENSLNVNVNLIEAETDKILWEESFKKEMSDIFKLQDEISLIISQKLKLTLMDTDLAPVSKVTTKNLKAYELFLKGQYYWNKRGRWLMNGLQYFEEAIAADPDFALANAGLGDAYAALGMYGIIPPLVSMEKAKRFATKAIQIDSGISHAHTTLGFIYGFYERKYDLATEYFEKGIELNPKGAMEHYWYSFFLSVVKRDLKKAEEIGFMSVLLEPHNAISCHITGLAYLAQRKFDDAIVLAKQSMEIDSSLFLPYFLLGWCLVEKEEYPAAIKTLNIGLNLSGRHSWPLGFLIMAKKKNGELAEAEALFEEIVQREKDAYFPTFGAVIGALALNKNDMALEFLKRGEEKRDILLSIFSHFQVMPSNLVADHDIVNYLKAINVIL